MPLIVSQLENTFKTIFNDMSGDDRKFCNDFSAAVKNYAESGSITTVDAGNISAGVFAGTGQGGITCDASVCADIIYAACLAMLNTGGNSILAQAMGQGVDAMITGGTVSTDVTGTCVPPSGSPFPLSGAAKGTQTGSAPPMSASFLSAFMAMNGMSSGNTDYMASQCAAAIDAYLKACTVSTEGEGVLDGSFGAGAMA
jgi:hypothetical protein